MSRNPSYNYSNSPSIILWCINQTENIFGAAILVSISPVCWRVCLCSSYWNVQKYLMLKEQEENPAKEQRRGECMITKWRRQNKIKRKVCMTCIQTRAKLKASIGKRHVMNQCVHEYWRRKERWRYPNLSRLWIYICWYFGTYGNGGWRVVMLCIILLLTSPIPGPESDTSGHHIYHLSICIYIRYVPFNEWRLFFF